MSRDRQRVIREMGLGPVWRLRAAAPAVAPAGDPAGEIAATEVHPEAQRPAGMPSQDGGLDWEGLASAVRDCRACRLCEGRQQAVLGVGDRKADWLFVGEGPGAEEDQRGEPFVGQAGKLLDNMMAAIGLRRGEDVYIANAVKCRPPQNRTPEADEMDSCRPFLKRQIALLSPRLIVALGRPAAQTLLGGEVKIGAARGRLFEYEGIPLVITYHPAYLLRNLPEKAKAWEDLCFMSQTMKSLKQQ